MAEPLRCAEHGFVPQMSDLRNGKSTVASRGTWGVKVGFGAAAKVLGEASLYYCDCWHLIRV